MSLFINNISDCVVGVIVAATLPIFCSSPEEKIARVVNSIFFGIVFVGLTFAFMPIEACIFQAALGSLIYFYAQCLFESLNRNGLFFKTYTHD